MKEKYLQQIGKLDEKILEKLATLSTNKKALGYFTNSLQWGMLKGFLGIK